MQKLVEGIHQFQKDIFRGKRELFEQLAGGQRPLALFITCSDSRINPFLLTQTEPGDLFIIRNAGNLVPPYSASPCAVAATIEYAVCALNIRDIVICGHSHCGAMSGLLAPENLEDLPAVRGWLSYADATRRIMQDSYKHISEAASRLTAAVEENVLVQLEHLRTHPSVAAALARKELAVHGWVYKFETGQVFTYRPDREQFAPVELAPIGPSNAEPRRV